MARGLMDRTSNKRGRLRRVASAFLSMSGLWNVPCAIGAAVVISIGVRALFGYEPVLSRVLLQ